MTNLLPEPVIEDAAEQSAGFEPENVILRPARSAESPGQYDSPAFSPEALGASATRGASAKGLAAGSVASNRSLAAGSVASNRGLAAVSADEFSFVDAVGGWRGLVEAIVPAFVFIVVFTVTRSLGQALAAALFLALVTVVTRLVERAPISTAIGGLFGLAVSAIWAWRSGEPTNFFALGLWQNAIYLVGVLVTILLRWPAVGVVIEILKSATIFNQEVKDGGDPTEMPKPFAGAMAWRHDPAKLRRYTLASWLWIGLFAIRLAVQVPLFLNQSVGWLGTARLILGTPLWLLVLFLTWAVLRPTPRASARV